MSSLFQSCSAGIHVCEGGGMGSVVVGEPDGSGKQMVVGRKEHTRWVVDKRSIDVKFNLVFIDMRW